jgi:hypothetical protein
LGSWFKRIRRRTERQFGFGMGGAENGRQLALYIPPAAECLIYARRSDYSCSKLFCTFAKTYPADMPFGRFAYVFEYRYFYKDMSANPANRPWYSTKKGTFVADWPTFFQNQKRWLPPTSLNDPDLTLWPPGSHPCQSAVHLGQADGSGTRARSMFRPLIAEFSR